MIKLLNLCIIYVNTNRCTIYFLNADYIWKLMESQSASKSFSCSVSSSTTKQDEDPCPLWQCVTKISRLGQLGGNCKWICNFCNQEKQGTYTRVRAHLLKISGKGINGCPKVKSDDLIEIKQIENEIMNRLAKLKPKEVPLPTTNLSHSIPLVEASQFTYSHAI